MIKRTFALAGFSLLFSLVLIMLCGTAAGQILCAFAAVSASVLFLLKKKASGAVFSVIAVMGALAAVLFAFNSEMLLKPASLLEKKQIEISGTVSDYSLSAPDGRQITLLVQCSVNGEKTELPFTVYSYESINALPGDTAEATVYVFDSTPEGVYKYHSVSLKKWIKCEAVSDVSVTHAKTRNLLYRIKIVRRNITGGFFSLFQSNADIVSALVLGESSLLDDDFKSSLQTAGVSHVFAVSGMHLSLWSSLVFLSMRKRSVSHIIPNLSAAVFVLFYCALTGFSPSVSRAAVMLLCVYAARIFRRRADGLNSLGLSAVCLLIFNPFLAGNVSFRLSFTATSAMLTVFRLFERSYSPENGKVRKIIKKSLNKTYDGVLISLSVILFTLPVSAVFFGRISLWSPVTSLLVTPLAELVMILSCLSLLLSPLGGLCSVTVLPCNICINALRGIVSYFGSLSFAVCNVRKTYIAVWYIITAAVCVCVFAFSKKRKKENTFFALGTAAAFILIFGIFSQLYNRSIQTITLPSAGSNTAIVLSDGNGANAVVIGAGDDNSKPYSLMNFAEENLISAPSALIIPRNRISENRHAVFIAEQLDFSEVYTVPDDETQYKSKNGTTRLGTYTLMLNDGVTLSVNSTENCSYAVMKSENIKTVFVFYPSSVITDTEALSGDILICRAAVPECINCDDFKNVYVMSAKTSEKLSLPDNAVSTADTDMISIKINLRENTYETDKRG